MLTISDYARSRKARGLSGGTKQSVHKAIEQGRVKAYGPEKLIDPEMADLQWEKNTRARASMSAAAVSGESPATGDGRGRPELPELAAAAANSTPEAAPAQQLHAEPGYLRSRATQAEADARIAQMKAAELEGQLVRIDQVRAQLAAQLAPVREAFQQLPSRIASALAAEGDPARVQTMLEAEIHHVLAPLARRSASAGDEAFA
jgi:hypothetical protein